jgi:hypothetical protein
MASYGLSVVAFRFVAYCFHRPSCLCNVVLSIVSRMNPIRPYPHYVRHKALKMTVSRDVIPYSQSEMYRRFEGTSYLYLQDRVVNGTSKKVIWLYETQLVFYFLGLFK